MEFRVHAETADSVFDASETSFILNVFRHEFLKLSYFPVLHVHFMIAWHQSLPWVWDRMQGAGMKTRRISEGFPVGQQREQQWVRVVTAKICVFLPFLSMWPTHLRFFWVSREGRGSRKIHRFVLQLRRCGLWREKLLLLRFNFCVLNCSGCKSADRGSEVRRRWSPQTCF